MNAQLSVDPWTLDARQDAQVGGEPRGAWGRVREEEEEEKNLEQLLQRLSIKNVWHFTKDDTACPHSHNAWQAEFYDQLCRLLDLSVNAYALKSESSLEGFLILNNILGRSK